MISPKRTKYRRHHRGRMKGKANRGNKLSFGQFGLQATSPSWLNSRQIEAGRRAITRNIRRGGQVWIRVFPDKSVTMRAAETRMGSGKGVPSFWVAVIKPGHVIFELDGVSEEVARVSMKLAAAKMPMRTRFVSKALIN